MHLLNRTRRLLITVSFFLQWALSGFLHIETPHTVRPLMDTKAASQQEA